MIVKIYKMNGDEQIIKDVRKFELRRNNVVCWYRINRDDIQQINDVATIQIMEREVKQ